MSDAYNAVLRSQILKLGKQLQIQLSEAVYVCFQGPSLETPHEYAYLNKIGADVVGMSTVPEVITAHHSQIKVIVLSVVTNICFPIENIKATSLEDVIEVANKAVPKLKLLIESIIKKELV
jgi:purine-nucleoside phosphorylase